MRVENTVIHIPLAIFADIENAKFCNIEIKLNCLFQFNGHIKSQNIKIR